MLCETNLSKTKSEARRLIEQGGIYLNGKKVDSVDIVVNKKFFENSSILIRRGKKQYHRVILKGETK